MTNDYVTRAQKFVKSIFPYLEKATTKDGIKQAVKQYSEKYKNRKVIFAGGISRAVLITADYVIKMDATEVRFWGNSETELKMYKVAEAEGYAHLLAKIDRFDFGGRSFYIMPRAHGIGIARYFSSYWTCDECEWIDNHIYDLHEYNYGILNKKLVIIDYASNVV